MKTKILYLILVVGLQSVLAQMSGKQFQDAVLKAASRVKSTHFELTNLKNFKPIRYTKENPIGTWNIGMHTWKAGTAEFGKVGALQTEAKILKKANTYEFVCATRRFPSFMTKDIFDAKWVTKGKKHLLKKIEKATVTFHVENNAIVTRATGPLVNDKDFLDDLILLLSVSRGMPHNSEFDFDKLYPDRIKELHKQSVSKQIPLNTLPHLLQDTSLFNYYDKKQDYYAFADNDKNLGFELYNTNTQLEYYVIRYISKSINVEKVKKELDVFAKKNTIKGAVVKTTVKDKNHVGVIVSFSYDGSLKGKQIAEGYNYVWDKYKKKVAKFLDKTLE